MDSGSILGFLNSGVVKRGSYYTYFWGSRFGLVAPCFLKLPKRVPLRDVRISRAPGSGLNSGVGLLCKQMRTGILILSNI